METTETDDEMLAELDALDDLEPGELLPCPFCGAEAERIDFDDPGPDYEDNDDMPENFGGSCIQCTQCQASSAVEFNFKETLYSRWNERIAPKPKASPAETLKELLETFREDAKAAREALSLPSGWQPIETVPRDVTVMLANFTERCLLTGAPHVWTATYVTQFVSICGDEIEHIVEPPRWCECSHAAMNENGEPTHWMPLPEAPALSKETEHA